MWHSFVAKDMVSRFTCKSEGQDSGDAVWLNATCACHSKLGPDACPPNLMSAGNA